MSLTGKVSSLVILSYDYIPADKLRLSPGNGGAKFLRPKKEFSHNYFPGAPRVRRFVDNGSATQ